MHVPHERLTGIALGDKSIPALFPRASLHQLLEMKVQISGHDDHERDYRQTGQSNVARE